MNKPLIYAGIGSRKTPLYACAMMTNIAEYLGDLGWLLHSGHADGADKAFERGAPRAQREIHLPWDGYNNTREGGCYIVPKPTPEITSIAAEHHPKWDSLSSAVKLLMCRNVTIILGTALDQPATCVIGWTPSGEWIGGTSHGFRIAATYKIPIFNIALEADKSNLLSFVNEIQNVGIDT